MFFLCNIASLVGGVVFSFLLRSFYLSSRAEQSVVKDLVYIHTTSEAMCPPEEGFSGLSGGALRKIEYFPLRTKSCLSVSEFFSFRTSC